MTIVFESGYIAPSGDEPLTHARIAHSNTWVTGGTAAATNTASGYDVDAPDTTLTYERWKPNTNPSAGSVVWSYDYGTSQTLDYICIAAHNLGTTGCRVAFQYYDTAWSGIIPFTAIPDDEPIMAIFEPRTGTRFRIILDTGTAPEIGVIKAGEALQMERPIYGGHAPIKFARQTILRSNYSETGEYLGRTKQRTYLSTSFAWNNLTAAWIRSNWEDLQKGIEAEPFWIAWRPASFGDVGFCQVDEVPIPQNIGVRDLMSVSMNVRARGYD